MCLTNNKMRRQVKPAQNLTSRSRFDALHVLFSTSMQPCFCFNDAFSFIFSTFFHRCFFVFTPSFGFRKHFFDLSFFGAVASLSSLGGKEKFGGLKICQQISTAAAVVKSQYPPLCDILDF